MTPSQKITCLLVDDDADDRDIFGMALEDIGDSFKLITVADAEEALKWVNTSEEKPDFIFLDLNMPRMSGTEVLIEMKKNEELKHTPIVIYSTSSADKDRNAAFQAGAHSYFTKPSAIRELTEKLKMLLASHASSPMVRATSAR